MRIRICMLGMALFFGGVSEGGLLSLSAAETAQVVTRGKPGRPDRDRYDHHRKEYKKRKDHRIRKIPPHYTKVYHGKKCYYYHDGFYYRPCAGGYYERFRPFIGMIVSVLPRRVHVVHRHGQEYLVCEGIFYKRIHTRYGFRYKVVGFA